MTYTGKIHHGVVVLDNGADLPEGTVVRIEVSHALHPRKGSPASVMRLAGTLSDEEADFIMRAGTDYRRVVPEVRTRGVM